MEVLVLVDQGTYFSSHASTLSKYDTMIRVCAIYRPAADPKRSFEEGVWFMGGGYLNLEPMNFNGSLSFSLSFRTFSTNDVEILWASNGVSDSYHNLILCQVLLVLKHIPLFVAE